MALGANYATLAELKSYLNINDTNDDDELTDALSSASRGIDKYCARQFNDAGSAAARVYYPDSAWDVSVDDFHTTTGLIIATDEDDSGSYETTWASTDYQLEPLNGVVDGETGWPYYRVRAIESRLFPCGSYRAPVQVTARWGWAAVPAAVKTACLMISAETFKMREAPFGVAGYGDFGVVRVRDNPLATAKLAPYRRYGVMVA